MGFKWIIVSEFADRSLQIALTSQKAPLKSYSSKQNPNQNLMKNLKMKNV